MKSKMPDTICAPATATGGAVCTIRISGPGTFTVVDSVVRFKNGDAASSKGGRVKFGSIEGVDDVLVSIFRAPHSYTGEDSAEIGCHASRFIIGEILSRLVAAGARMAECGEFTKRAFLNGKMDLSQAEAVADVIAAESRASHKVAFSQLRGRYSGELAKLRERLLELTSLLELELDFSEEDLEFADRGKLKALLEECTEHIASLKESYRIGNAIREGVPVAIVGAPNSGKSTLLNALVGDDRAIVSDIPGTTRDTVEEAMTLGGIRFRFIDTAGLHDTADSIEKMGIERSLRKISEAGTVICLIDGTSSLEENREVLDSVRGRISADQNLIVAVNKADIQETELAEAGCGSERGVAVAEESDCRRAESSIASGGCDTRAALSGVRGTENAEPLVVISAKTGAGLDRLRSAITEPYQSALAEDAVIVTSQRHFEALGCALESLTAASASLASGVPGDLISEDLRAALHSIGSILGDTITTDEILGEIFSRFCIGK